VKIIDISWPISPDMTTYKDRSIVSFEPSKRLEQDGARETKITLGSHSGTHVDAPAHFFERGDTVERLPLEQLVGPCVVLDLTHVDEKITREDLEQYDLDEGVIVLLKTKNSETSPIAPFDSSFIYLDESGARYLAEHQIGAVGIDYLGIERNQSDHATHKTLIRADIPIIEGLRLRGVEEGEYILFCLPLKLVGLDAAPARALLLDDEDE